MLRRSSLVQHLIAMSLLAIPAAAWGQTSAITVGTYPLEITFGGGVMEGALEITAPRPDSLAIKLTVGEHTSPVRIVRQTGNRLVLESTTPGMQIRYDLEFKSDSVTGPFTYEDQSGSVAGRRRPTGH